VHRGIARITGGGKKENCGKEKPEDNSTHLTKEQFLWCSTRKTEGVMKEEEKKKKKEKKKNEGHTSSQASWKQNIINFYGAQSGSIIKKKGVGTG